MSKEKTKFVAVPTSKIRIEVLNELLRKGYVWSSSVSVHMDIRFRPRINYCISIRGNVLSHGGYNYYKDSHAKQYEEISVRDVFVNLGKVNKEEQMARFMCVPTEAISKEVQNKLFDLGYGWHGSGKKGYNANPTESHSHDACILLKSDGRLQYSSHQYYSGLPDTYSEISVRDVFVNVVAKKKKEPEEMIDIDGKQFSKSTIKEALKAHVGA